MPSPVALPMPRWRRSRGSRTSARSGFGTAMARIAEARSPANVGAQLREVYEALPLTEVEWLNPAEMTWAVEAFGPKTREER